MLLTFYKGTELTLLRRLPRPRLVHITEAHHHSHPPSTGNQILGSFLGIMSCFSYAAWVVIQVNYITLRVLLVPVSRCSSYVVMSLLVIFTGESGRRLPLPLLHRCNGMPLRCTSVHCRGCLRSQGHGTLEVRTQHQTIFLSLCSK